jgi:hypothetical protein
LKSYLFPFVIITTLSGCATTEFKTVDKDTYQLSKNSDACAAGAPSSALNHLKMEAEKFCAGRKEIPEEIESSTEIGIPYIRCASAKLTFKCVNQK